MEFDMDWFADVTAWTIAGILYVLFMTLIWIMPTLGSGWEGYELERIVITVLALPVCYVIAKWRLSV